MNHVNFDDLLKRAHLPPPMTRREREAQLFDFAYGNLACTNNHKPTREAFAKLAQERGWTEKEFEMWAARYTWSDPTQLKR